MLEFALAMSVTLNLFLILMVRFYRRAIIQATIDMQRLAHQIAIWGKE